MANTYFEFSGLTFNCMKSSRNGQKLFDLSQNKYLENQKDWAKVATSIASILRSQKVHFITIVTNTI